MVKLTSSTSFCCAKVGIISFSLHSCKYLLFLLYFLSTLLACCWTVVSLAQDGLNLSSSVMLWARCFLLCSQMKTEL